MVTFILDGGAAIGPGGLSAGTAVPIGPLEVAASTQEAAPGSRVWFTHTATKTAYITFYRWTPFPLTSFVYFTAPDPAKSFLAFANGSLTVLVEEGLTYTISITDDDVTANTYVVYTSDYGPSSGWLQPDDQVVIDGNGTNHQPDLTAGGPVFGTLGPAFGGKHEMRRTLQGYIIVDPSDGDSPWPKGQDCSWVHARRGGSSAQYWCKYPDGVGLPPGGSIAYWGGASGLPGYGVCLVPPSNGVNAEGGVAGSVGYTFHSDDYPSSLDQSWGWFSIYASSMYFGVHNTEYMLGALAGMANEALPRPYGFTVDDELIIKDDYCTVVDLDVAPDEMLTAAPANEGDVNWYVTTSTDLQEAQNPDFGPRRNPQVLTGDLATTETLPRWGSGEVTSYVGGMTLLGTYSGGEQAYTNLGPSYVETLRALELQDGDWLNGEPREANPIAYRLELNARLSLRGVGIVPQQLSIVAPFYFGSPGSWVVGRDSQRLSFRVTARPSQILWAQRPVAPKFTPLFIGGSMDSVRARFDSKSR